jgi:PAS domain-containing protein
MTKTQTETQKNFYKTENWAEKQQNLLEFQRVFGLAVRSALNSYKFDEGGFDLSSEFVSSTGQLVFIIDSIDLEPYSFGFVDCDPGFKRIYNYTKSFILTNLHQISVLLHEDQQIHEEDKFRHDPTKSENMIEFLNQNKHLLKVCKEEWLVDAISTNNILISLLLDYNSSRSVVKDNSLWRAFFDN